MREKELRLALVCYGGVSLAVYMHGITKELWTLLRASRAWHDGADAPAGSGTVYARLLDKMGKHVRLRVLTDIIAGASAGGINGIFLGHAIACGGSLDPLTELWLETADVEHLLDPEAKPDSRFSKFWATPIAWAALRKQTQAIDELVEPAAREEVRAKLSRFVRARWFEPPFDGAGFTRLLLDAFDAMDGAQHGPPLIPDGQPLDLFVTVTDFTGFPQRLKLNSPAEVVETEHRIVIGFHDRGLGPRRLDTAEALTFAARATASFPGAFPPFQAAELDGVLAERGRTWTGRDQFLAALFPRRAAAGMDLSRIALIDGSVLANAPFGPAIGAMRQRPAHREIDRRFVYIDPKPGLHGMRLTAGDKKDDGDDRPGFFSTIFRSMSDIPREQPIRDNLEAIEAMSGRIRRLRRVTRGMQAEVEAVIEAEIGGTLFLNRPTRARLVSWRQRAQQRAARDAGYAYVGYAHLKLAGVMEDAITLLAGIADVSGVARETLRTSLWRWAADTGFDHIGGGNVGGASDAVRDFFRAHDLSFRIRRLRFVARQLSELVEARDQPPEGAEEARKTIYALLGDYIERRRGEYFSDSLKAAMPGGDPAATMAALADALDLRALDDHADGLLADALAGLPKETRRPLLLAYLGFPFYDIATLPLLQGEGLDEFDPIKVDRISPDDARAIREGGAAATLKGIQFNSFGAFFSRAYRENDYLWGRLHGADRLIDIVLSALPEGATLAPGDVASLKREAFQTILREEKPRLTHIRALIEDLELEVGAGTASLDDEAPRPG